MADEAYEKAVDLLARRPHFVAEIRRKLRQRGFEEEACESAVDRLLELRYLDDRRCAIDWIAARLRRGPVGRLRLRVELERRGVSSAIVDQALEDSALEGDLAMARRAAERWRLRSRGEEAALMRHLDRRGFRKGDILTVVEELRKADS